MLRKPLHWLLISLIFLVNPFFAAPGSAAKQALPAGAIQEIIFTPDQLVMSGDVTSQANCQDASVCAWVGDAPLGSVLLGVDPRSPQPIDWDGGSLTAELDLPAASLPALLVLKISWPPSAGKGLHSPEKNRYGTISLDGKTVWDMRTLHQSSFDDYYAEQYNPIITTLNIQTPGKHSLRFSVGPHTAWDISSIELRQYPYPAQYRGIGYSPYRDCQMPGGSDLPSDENISDDMFRLANTSNAVRTYSSLGPNAGVPAKAIQAGLAVFPGAWLDYPKTSLAEEDAEVLGLINQACQNDVQGVIVGNELYLRQRSPQSLAYLQQRIQAVRAGISACGKSVPITTAEIDNLAFTWASDTSSTVTGINPQYRPILDSLDFFMVHIYPFWSGMPVEGAAEFAIERYLAMQAYLQQEYPGQNKWLIIGETGWPSGGSPNGLAVASQANQRKYMLEMMPLVEAHAVQLLYFDAFDELWKIEEPGGVGQRWGYGYSDRSAKHFFYGVLTPSNELAASLFSLPEKLYLPNIHRSGPPPEPPARTFAVYNEWPEPPGHFTPSGWMGEIGQVGMALCDRSNPHSGELALRVSYTPASANGWGGVYWQYPANNWGDQPQGVDLSWANQVTFWARGAVGGESVRFFAGGIGGPGMPYPDSIQPQVTSGFIQLSTQWQQYTLDLTGKDLSHVVGGFGWMTDTSHAPQGVSFYLDDVVYSQRPALQALTGEPDGGVRSAYIMLPGDRLPKIR